MAEMNLFSLIAILFLTGCSTTAYQLKESPGGVYAYTVDVNYQTVYRRILQASKRCYETGEIRIDGSIYDDNKSGEVTVAIEYGGTIKALYMVEINSLTDNETAVKVYYARSLTGAWQSGAENSQEWSKGNLGICTHKQPS